MPLSIRDEETTQLVRRLAARRGVSLTEAIRTAVRNELAGGESGKDRPLTIDERLERLRALQTRVRAKGGDFSKADKAFYDSLNDE